MAEGARQDSWIHGSLLWLQEQGPGLHLQVGLVLLLGLFAFGLLYHLCLREELEGWEQDGLLTLHTAFSRDQVGAHCSFLLNLLLLPG